MAGKGTEKAARQDEELMLAAWEWAQECMADQDYVVGLAMLPTSRKGVWKIQARAMNQVGGKAVSVAVQVQVEWPSATYQTLAGALFAALHKLNHEMGVPPPLLA